MPDLLEGTVENLTLIRANKPRVQSSNDLAVKNSLVRVVLSLPVQMTLLCFLS